MLTTTERALTTLKRLARFALNEGATFPALWYALGCSYDRRGKHASAAAAFTRAIAAADRSTNRRMFTARQRWQYRLELAHALAGSGGVQDPLFACRSTPNPGSAVSATQRRSAPGYFEARWGFRGLRIDGFLNPNQIGVEKVRVLVDGKLLREVSVSKFPLIPPFFQINLQRQTVATFAVDSVLRVETPGGGELLFDGCTDALVHAPHGADTLSNETCAVDKKGFLAASGAPQAMRHEKFLETYEKARKVFARELNTPLLLLYGTLLGLHRSGDFITGDDDFDVGYVSMLTTAEAVKQEAMQIVIRLVTAGFTVSFNRSGRLFRLRLPSSNPDTHLDVHTVWREKGSVWIHPQARLGCQLDDFLPASIGTLRGTTVDLPRDPEAFLSAYYGQGWTTPDPSYSTSARAHTHSMRQHFARTHVTPADFVSMQREIDAVAKGRPVGRLISIGSYSLYPLEDYEQNCDW